MKKIYLLVLLCAVTLQTTWAQTGPTSSAQYFFKTKTGTALEDMTVSTTLIGAIRELDQVSAETGIGFPFSFVSKSFDAFRVFSSGAVVLSKAGIENNDGFQAFYPWADDLFTGDNGYIKYKVVGTNNRKLVIEFYLARYVGKTSAAIADKKFQVWLFENSNVVQYVYGDGTVVGANAIVAIVGNVNTVDLLQVNTVDHTTFVPTWETYSSTWPGFGRSYLFSPAEYVAVDPVATISAAGNTSVCQGTSVLLSANLQDAVATGYQWSKNGVPVTNANDAQFYASESGSYTVQIQHEAGVTTSQAINVFVSSLNATVKSTNITCNANSNGTITVLNAAGGNNVYEYSIGNNVWQQGEVFAGVSAGTYNVQMRSGNCQRLLGSVTILDNRTAPAVSVITGSGGACANVTLTANPANALSYSWSNGATGSSLVLGNNDADGNYTVTVSNGPGCTGSASYTYNKQNQLNSYVILASKAVSLGENNVVNGAIGNSGSLPVYIEKNSIVKEFIRSASIRLKDPVTVNGDISYNAATVNRPTVYTNTSVVSNLPSYSVADNFSGTLSANYDKLTIGKKAKVSLSGTIFGKIIVKEGAEVTFTAADISIDELQTEDGNKTVVPAGYTTVNFAANTIIRVKNKIEVGKRGNVNATGATFYLSDLKADVEKVVIEGSNTTFSGNVILVNGSLTIKGTSATEPCTMTGAFICETVVSDKYVTWNRNLCNVFAPRAVGIKPVVIAPIAKVIAYPNPANGGRFNVSILSGMATKADVLVLNENGVVIKTESFANIVPGKTIPVNLSNQPAGVYLLKVTTSQGSQTIKVVVK